MILSIFNNQIFMVSIWAAIFVIAVVVEISTTDLVSIWFAGGAVITLITAVIKIPFAYQVIVWIISSAICLAIFKPLFGKKLALKHQRTNLDQLIGQDVYLLKAVSPHQLGEAKVRDVIWSVSSNDVIEASEYAEVISIEGNKLIVKKKETK